MRLLLEELLRLAQIHMVRALLTGPGVGAYVANTAEERRICW